MTEQLPISIQLNSQLIAEFDKIQSIVNKFEAQFNFQTLTAGWYGDEESILSIELYLETSTSFIEQQQMSFTGEHYLLADDVFAYHDKTDNMVTCIIALTDSELALLHLSAKKQQKILIAFLQVKLHKVLNALAGKLAFSAI